MWCDGGEGWVIVRTHTHVSQHTYTPTPFHFIQDNFHETPTDATGDASVPAYLDGKDPNTPVMMYCTGGIRCDIYSTYLRNKVWRRGEGVSWWGCHGGGVLVEHVDAPGGACWGHMYSSMIIGTTSLLNYISSLHPTTTGIQQLVYAGRGCAQLPPQTRRARVEWKSLCV